MFYAIGQHTKTVYARGSKSDCIRDLNGMFPSFSYQESNLKTSSKIIDKIFQEPIVISSK